MARAPSKILGAAEVKALDLDKQIEAADKEVTAAEKQLKKAISISMKLYAKRDKAASKLKAKAPEEWPPIGFGG